MGLNVGGFEQHADWPKMGPSLLIAACVILAVRTAKWQARYRGSTTSDRELDVEIEHSIELAGRVLAMLVAHQPGIFPRAKSAWYVANDEDVPK